MSTDDNENGIPDKVEKVAERNIGKIIAGGSIGIILAAGVSLAVGWNDFVVAVAAPHIKSAVERARAEENVYTTALEIQVACLEGKQEPVKCRDDYDDKIDEGNERLKETEGEN